MPQQHVMRLLDSQELQRSPVVANCAMNRERQLLGSNSYERDLGLNILSFLRGHKNEAPILWVDLCCGSGRALIEAAAELEQSNAAEHFQIIGIDLAGVFAPNRFPHIVTLQKQELGSWNPSRPPALVTCVHGLHYVGDKLAVIAKALANLVPNGLFIANLDLANFRHADGKPAGRMIAARLRNSGLTYDTRRRLVRCTGPRQIDFGLQYIGANDQAGPNYTRQAAVDSYYSR
jgi:SAM-dependent methyltransferase